MKLRLCAFADEAARSLDGQIDALTRNGIGLIEVRGIDREKRFGLYAGRGRKVRPTRCAPPASASIRSDRRSARPDCPTISRRSGSGSTG